MTNIWIILLKHQNPEILWKLLRNNEIISIYFLIYLLDIKNYCQHCQFNLFLWILTFYYIYKTQPAIYNMSITYLLFPTIIAIISLVDLVQIFIHHYIYIYIFGILFPSKVQTPLLHTHIRNCNISRDRESPEFLTVERFKIDSINLWYELVELILSVLIYVNCLHTESNKGRFHFRANYF